jgi:ABC-type multidrug transport system, ATPase and permease components
MILMSRLKDTLSVYLLATDLLGTAKVKYISYATALGIFWFLVEASFVIVIKIYLASIGALMETQVGLGGVVLDVNSWPIWVGSVALISYGLMRACGQFLKFYFSGTVSQDFVRRQREAISSQSIYLSNPSENENLVDIFTNRVIQAGYTINYLYSIIVLLVSLVLIFCLGLWIAPVEFALSVLILAVLLLPFRKLAVYVKESGNGVNQESGLITKKLLLILKNRIFLRIFKLESWAFDDIKASLESYERHYRVFSATQSFKATFPALVGILTIALVTFFSKKYLQTSGVTLIAYLYVFYRFAQSLGDIQGIYNELLLQVPSLIKIRSIQRSSAELMASQSKGMGGNNSSVEQKNIEVNSFQIFDLCVGYGDKILISGLNILLKRGDLWEIRGPSGSGKSSLLSVVLGLNPSLSGHVQVNGRTLENEFLREFTRSLGYVGPDPFILDGTVEQNLRFGLRDGEVLDREYALSLLQKLNLFVEESSPLGIAISESALSTGQKQRLSLVRCLLRRPQIIIFDEATANLDRQNEFQVASIISALREDSIVINVTHKNNVLGEPTVITDLGLL